MESYFRFLFAYKYRANRGEKQFLCSFEAHMGGEF